MDQKRRPLLRVDSSHLFDVVVEVCFSCTKPIHSPINKNQDPLEHDVSREVREIREDIFQFLGYLAEVTVIVYLCVEVKELPVFYFVLMQESHLA